MGQLVLRMQVHNPNGFSLPIHNLTYTLRLNELHLITSQLSFDKTISANGMVELQVPVQFQYGELLNSVCSILEHHKVKFQFTGKLDLGLLTIPFSKSGEFVFTR